MTQPKTWPARRVKTMRGLRRPGDYYGPTADGSVWFLLPIADKAHPLDHGKYDPAATAKVNRAEYLTHRRNGFHRVASPPWTFRECADGSLEIRASIASGRGDPEGEYWHGFLDEGNLWRSA